MSSFKAMFVSEFPD